MSSVTLNLLRMQAVRLCHVIRPVKACVSLNERDISFVNRMKYFVVISEKKPYMENSYTNDKLSPTENLLVSVPYSSTSD
jgi:hypothetical protein